MNCRSALSVSFPDVQLHVPDGQFAHPGRAKWFILRMTADGDGPISQTFASGDQITGFQATGTSRYFVPSFSTWPIEGKVKWKPTTIAFSAAAMS
jgi:hypothetical protein